ncbi:sulfurtransferase [Planctomicrobium sp. SH664]|uniref:sulfurtransferase n=1 Tax=Planctomicrobium sp. SH664 TaxID=3448125 RepID=UPI003F5B171A
MTSFVSQLPFVNIAAYKFVSLNNLETRRQQLRQFCRERHLKGTILLAPEGINLFLAGERNAIDELVELLRSDELLADLEVKESFSDSQPFERMLVKIKEETIAFGIPGIDPRQATSARITPHELESWLSSGKDVTLLDVRNNYEVAVGTFENAIPIDVDHFRDLPEAVERLPEELRKRPVVMFCTGGIRCEKAGPYLEQAGFEHVYQLHGGILKYFEDVGGAHYRGECFVFDKRVALDPQLKETDTKQCYACLQPLSIEDQQSPLYDPPHACPHCHQTPEQKQVALLQARRQRIREVTTPLPGSVAYDNARPLNVPQKFSGLSLFDFVRQVHPHLGDDYWRTECDLGRIHQGGKPVPGDRIVREGEQFAHLEPSTTEPDINPDIEILHEDQALVVVSKPAPLPLHPCGRFNRNSLQWILNAAYRPLKLRPAHRLDANTTGVVIFSKTRTVSAAMQAIFHAGEVEKEYLVRVQGQVPWQEILCEAPISRESTNCGGRKVVEDGLPSRTRFQVLDRFDDGSTLLRAFPETGRTNQIRIHAWHLGFPVCGDPLYLPNQQLGDEQTQAPGAVMCLHAAKIRFRHPTTDEFVAFEAPSPNWTTEADG